jgi:hypothetical protein
VPGADVLTLILLAIGAGGTVVLVIFGLPPFLRWLRREDSREPPQTNEELEPAPAFHVHLWGMEANRPAADENTSAHSDSGVTRGARASPADRSSEGAADRILFDGTLEVTATGYGEIHHDLHRGDRVHVLARETSGQPFDFYIMNRTNFVRFCRDREGSDIAARMDEPIVDLSRVIPRDGTWFFVIDTYGKQNDRQVSLEVRVN